MVSLFVGSDCLNKRLNESFEILIYKCIGVLWFKKIVLCFEKMLYVNRGYSLMNYHPEKMTTEGIKNFFWQLLYNCTLHITSIVFSLLYFSITFIGKVKIMPLNAIVLMMIIFNLYCIFLQRYIYLKMRKVLIKKEDILKQQYNLKIKKLDEMAAIHISEKLHKETLELIDRVERVFLKNCSCIINEEDLYVLEHMKEILCNVDMKIRTISFGEIVNEVSIDGGISFINPCKRVNVMVEILKYLFNRKRYVLDKKNIVLVTATDRCEDLYNAVFGDESTEVELVKIRLLKYIYMNKVQVE